MNLHKFFNTVKFYFYVLSGSEHYHYYLKWKNTGDKNYLLHCRQPWLVFEAISFLEELDLKGGEIFEYGCGGSTLYWLSKGAQVFSVEHDPDWYKKMLFYTQNNKSVNLRLIEPENISSANGEQAFDPANPDLYQSHRYPGKKFEQYVRQIDSFPDNYFDIILIDGRSRPSCLKHSITKIKPNGLIILDNSNRKYYLDLSKTYIKNFQLMRFKGLFAGNVKTISMTDIYKRIINEKGVDANGNI
jgi:hypothetical protein